MTQKKFNELPTTRAIVYSIVSDEGVVSKIEYKVGQSVSVYAPKKGQREVDDNDLWYGIIECLCVDKRPKALQPFWVKIRWYWSKDLQEQSFKSASQSDSRFFDMRTNELLQSDLTQWSEASILAGQNTPSRWSSLMRSQDLKDLGVLMLYTPVGGIIQDVFKSFHHQSLSDPDFLLLKSILTSLMNYSKHFSAVQLKEELQLEYLEMDGLCVRSGDGTAS
ncbi:uncharacterized protein F5891DRAFT_980044 [Suillus fuscotomentosus]|uniref:BAH domain-containing protein n=1 Tax=Suillus fuscotomentosus TaxID=1912939 RepID=A0AAD4E762_9AGAM|nr:uncharacterized protein F5891DRAFT_980044 [Suillus fuscotomentosus]KAG1900830.1 hypothetical protein F5891DRAFT_980044 [Suillus fuscotomentosus]